MEYLTAIEAAKTVAPFIGLSVDNDLDKLFLYIDLAQRKAWKAGAYKGFLREVDLKVYDNNGHKYIKTPHGYNVLMGLNIGGKPVELRDSYFQFHHNSYGSLTDKCLLQFVNFGLVYRDYPTLLGPQLHSDNTPFEVGVLALGPDDNFAYVGGIDVEGNPTYSYQQKDELRNPVAVTDKSDLETIHGLKIKLEKDTLIKVSNRKFKEITSLAKDPTFGAVEFYALPVNTNIPKLLARLEPHQTISRYKIYEIPDNCKCGGSVHALVKISQPDKIINPSQRLIIEDMEALISLIMAMDMSFGKKDIEAGEAFGIKGIMSLDSENEAGRSPTIQPIQYIGLDDEMPDDHMYCL